MSLTVPLYAVVLILAGVGLAYAAYRILHASLRVHRCTCEEAAKLRETIALNTAALAGLTEAMAPACGELRSHIASVPKLLEAVATVGNAQLEILQRGTVQQQAMANPFGKTNGPRAPRDVAGANLEYDVRQMQRAEGITREEALLRMNGANQRSVWEGNDMFEGWNR